MYLWKCFYYEFILGGLRYSLFNDSSNRIMGTILKKKQISKILNIKGNLLMLDTTEIFLSKKKSISKKKINICDWFFKEHLVANPIMPGILITETILKLMLMEMKNMF